MDAFEPRKRESHDAQVDAPHIDLARRGKHASRLPGGRGTHVFISQIAAGQRGLVTRAQLLENGIDHNLIDRAIRQGGLHPIQRGVYGVLPLTALPDLAREHAAVLAFAPNAFLSHATAAAIWKLRPAPANVHITVVGRNAGPSRPGLLVHNVARLDRRDTRHRYGLPVTAPARTTLDLAPSLSPSGLAEMFDEALHGHIMRRTEVTAMLERYPRRPGSPRVAALAHEDRQPTWTRAHTERRLLALLRRAHLPIPEVNVLFGPFELDFFWREAGVVVESDGYEFHSSRHRLESDHQRDLYLQARGMIVARFSWRQIRDEPEMVLVQIAALLARRQAA